MPIHDWTKVSPGTFHDFHTAWIASLRTTLNSGLLPQPFYALAEQLAGEIGPDILTLEEAPAQYGNATQEQPANTVALLDSPPKVKYTVQLEPDWYGGKRRSLMIRHSSDDRMVAIVEILSPGNKSSQRALNSFLSKAISALQKGIHLLLIDLFPPGALDPNGIHGALSAELGVDAKKDFFQAAQDKPLTMAAYSASSAPKAFIEPLAVGNSLPEMPLFLEPDRYVYVPLESTYMAAYAGVPQRWRRVIEA